MAQRDGPTGNGGGLGSERPSPAASKYFDPKNTNTPFNRGLQAYDAGDYKLADRLFDEVLSETPDDSTVLVLSGMAMVGRGDFKDARKQFDHAIRVDHQNLDAHREMGVALAKTGDAKGAQDMLSWLKAKKTSCAAKCDDAGKIDRAIDTVQQALTPAPAKAG